MTTLNRTTAGPALLAYAMKGLTGLPYIFGGDPFDGEGTDCSGTTEYGASGVGITIARDTFGQYVEYICDARNGLQNSPNEPGDQLFIPGSDAVGDEPGHVMLYHSPGVVFQAEMTGTLIGLYPYDTDQWEYRCRVALAFNVEPPPPILHPTPTAQQVERAGLVPVNQRQAAVAHLNGWNLYHWDQNTGRFIGVPTPSLDPHGPTEYANRDYKTKRPVAHGE